jgi:putative addiction module component (TIGR02574 family)
MVERLLESLSSPVDPEIERLWAEEAERRIEQFDRGEVEAIPAEKVFADLRARFAR